MNTPLRIAAAIAVLLVSSAADARPRHHRVHVAKAAPVSASICQSDNNGRTTCNGPAVGPPMGRRHIDPNGNDTVKVVGGRKSGWPRAFCGAEASAYIFGETKRELWLAYNWIRKFQRTSPAPGMAAARSGHVMVLMSHVSGSDWMVHDGNSGGHLTREHVRSIAGYVIVNPHAPRITSN